MITFELTDKEALVLLEILAGVAAAERIVVPKESEKNRHVHSKIRSVVEMQLCHNQAALDIEVGRDIGRYIEDRANNRPDRNVRVSSVVADVVESVRAKLDELERMGDKVGDVFLDDLRLKIEEEQMKSIKTRQMPLPFDKKNK